MAHTTYFLGANSKDGFASLMDQLISPADARAIYILKGGPGCGKSSLMKKVGQAAQDAEGLQTMRTLARNMTFLMRSIRLGREKYGLPEQEEPLRTSFVR